MRKFWLPLIAILLLFLLLQFNVTGWVTRTISSTQDNKETMICNSNGKCWEPTGSNIQLAIDDLSSTNGGTVWLPAGTFLIDEPIRTGTMSVTLEGTGWGMTAVPTTKPVTMIRINKYVAGGFNDYAIIVGNDSDVSEGTIIRNLLVDGADSEDAAGGIYIKNCMHCKLEQVVVDDFFRTSPPSIGVNLSATTRGSYYNVFHGLKVRRCTIGVALGYNTNGNSYFSGMITNGRALSGDYPIGLLIHDADTNSVYNVDIEGHTNGTGVVIESDERSGSQNKFFGTRFESNDRNVLIRAGNTGLHKFYGCSAANTIGTSVTDNGNNPSYFRDFYGQDTFYLDDTLHLKPGNVPSSPQEGMIYSDSSTHRVYYYNGSSWVDLTN